MRATPSLRRLASTMTRPASRSVMCETSTLLPSAMPTRSAPSSRALVFTCCEVRGVLVSFMALFECLKLPRHDALVALLADPAHVPLREAGQIDAAFSVVFIFFLQSYFFRRLLRNVLLHLGEV